MANDFLYLDHAAATPVDARVLEAMLPYYSSNFYNASATYLPARAVADQLAAVRQQVAEIIGARSREIVFTAGSSEANNLAIHGMMRMYPEGNILVSAIEHESVLRAAEHYAHKEIAVDQHAMINLEDLRAKLDDNTVMVSVMYANNEVGTIEPIREIAKIITEVREARGPKGLPIYLHTDAAQAANYLDLHVARLGIDFMTLNGGKIYGPKQSGVLYIRGGIALTPIVDGGGQEFGLRSGTENIAQAVGFATALEIAQGMKSEETHRLQGLLKFAIKELVQKIPSVVINGSTKNRLPNNLHITIPDTDNERVLLELEQRNILGAAGSACSASNEEPSHVLKAMGLADKEAQSSLRFTFGRTTSEADIHKLVDALVEILKR